MPQKTPMQIPLEDAMNGPPLEGLREPVDQTRNRYGAIRWIGDAELGVPFKEMLEEADFVSCAAMHERYGELWISEK